MNQNVCYTPEICKIFLVYVKYYKQICSENLKIEFQAELVLKFLDASRISIRGCVHQLVRWSVGR